jgi:hypothetical protein
MAHHILGLKKAALSKDETDIDTNSVMKWPALFLFVVKHMST